MIANFSDCLKKGKTSELLAEKWFDRNHYKYINLTDNKEYQKKDIDYMVDGLGTIEVKNNINFALKGIQENFMWIELSVDNKLGWWYLTEADFFLFFYYDNSKFVFIPNTEKFRQFVNNKIETADHTENSYYRFDYKKDYRYNGVITAKSMRLYLSELKRNGLPYRTYTN
jgi:hypothetical protein